MGMIRKDKVKHVSGKTKIAKQGDKLRSELVLSREEERSYAEKNVRNGSTR